MTGKELFEMYVYCALSIDFLSWGQLDEDRKARWETFAVALDNARKAKQS